MIAAGAEHRVARSIEADWHAIHARLALAEQVLGRLLLPRVGDNPELLLNQMIETGTPQPH